jgi:signal transduction histidine kinase
MFHPIPRVAADFLAWLDRIWRSAERLDALIKDVLTYSRVAKEEIRLSGIDLENMIEEIIATDPEFQSPRARIFIEKPMHRVLGHEAYLMQCVTNLLSNAVKFVSDGVVPTIRIRSETFDRRVRVWFEDNGIGIDAAYHERIFQIFGQIYPQNKFGGTGIGLAIVRKAVQRMNGEVGVDSGIDQGSRFWLVLNGEHYVEQASDIAH